MANYQIPPLILGDNLSYSPKRVKEAHDLSPRVLVIGGGVTGLTTAWVLLDRGYHVTIVSKQWASLTQGQRLTSQIAGALWEFPPAVCGQHTDAISLEHSKTWAMVAYHIWDAIAADPEAAALSGVRMRPSRFFFPCPIERDPKQLHKMREIQSAGVRGFIRDKSVTKAQGINPEYGAVDSYEVLSPIIDTDQATLWLMDLVKSKGARLVTERIRGDLFMQEDELLRRFKANVIVNCTGLAGAELASDATCYPIRGALIRVVNDGKDFPQVRSALTITADAVHNANEIVFIVPRNDNILLLGGIAECHDWNLDLKLESPVIQRMRKRCEAFLPSLKNARLDEQYPLAQGLRPSRGTNVRVERELRRKRVPGGSSTKARFKPSRIVHSYGHGGSGWSLGFGCAADVADLVVEALANTEPMAMARVQAAEYEEVEQKEEPQRVRDVLVA